jgi:hypothetical protein
MNAKGRELVFLKIPSEVREPYFPQFEDKGLINQSETNVCSRR